jgi:hypothetical protein
MSSFRYSLLLMPTGSGVNKTANRGISNNKSQNFEGWLRSRSERGAQAPDAVQVLAPHVDQSFIKLIATINL